MQEIDGIGRISTNRSPEFRDYLRSAAQRGICPLCEVEKTETFICEGDYWRAWQSRFPYSGHETHLVLATKEHWGIEDLTAASWAEWGEINSMLIQKYGLKGGGIFMRFGELRYNAGTLYHLHSHMQVPDRKLFAINVLYKDEHLAKFLQVEK